MARKKKKKQKDAEVEPAVQLGGDARTSMRELLRGVKVPEPSAVPTRPIRQPESKRESKPRAPQPTPGDRPSDTLRGDDRIAYWQAFSGVRPLRAKVAMPTTNAPRPKSEPRPQRSTHEDDQVRARLAALVAGDVHFDVERREDDRVLGLRTGAPTAVLRELGRRDASPEATLDLHGMTAKSAEAEVAKFVRRQHRAGARRVRIVHGKGLHSEVGGVLGDRVVHALTNGAAAPVVRAFASAAPELGGVGALIVELTRT